MEKKVLIMLEANKTVEAVACFPYHGTGIRADYAACTDFQWI
jgi:hypothetical protein